MTAAHFNTPSQVDVIRYEGDYIACGHDDYSISLINLNQQDEIKTLFSSTGHSSFINAIDIAPEGVLASTGDDKSLILWEIGPSAAPGASRLPHSKFPLSGTGKQLKFWQDNDSNKLLILEAGNKLQIFDWRKSQWLMTINPGQLGCCGPSGYVKSIGILDNEIIAVGAGWWKKFNLSVVSGGSGYTKASSEGRLNDCAKDVAITLASNTSSHVGSINPANIHIYDLREETHHGFHLQYDIPSQDILDIALEETGSVLAVSSGYVLSFIRNPTSWHH